jgi:hypothetical protein
MEYVEGKDLERLVKESGPLSVGQACEYLRQAALGLQHAHEHGLVHRDIKPSNLMVSGPGQATVKLLDLGLARLHEDFGGGRENTFMTSDGSATLGTVDYQAPEQAIDFHTADIRADIYSLGCTLYYLLTGEPPFGTGPLAVKLMKHQQMEPPDLKELRRDVPLGLLPIARRMLAKDPADRYATPGEAAQALEMLNRPPRKRFPILLAAAVGGTALSLGLLYAALPSSSSSSPSSSPSSSSPSRTVEKSPQPTVKPKPPPGSVEAIVPEAADYELVFDLDLARLGKDITYDVDRRNKINRPFDRVAYFLELRKHDGEMQYLYVSMAAFTTDVDKIGIPTVGTTFQTTVANMNVYSNVTGITTGTGLPGGNIEFWASNYGPINSANVPNADSGKFDFGDKPGGPTYGHGCMQVHNHLARQTLFAINKWRAGGDKVELGIGNNPNGNPDWTFTETGATFRAKRLRVLVRCR